MSTALQSQQRRRLVSKLPLGLQPHHLRFVAFLGSIVILGTAYSIVYGTHLQNVRLSAGGDAADSFPSTLPGAAVAPSVQTGADGSANLGPIPPTIALPPHHALNYWANRKNIVNRVFVKKAWLWTTLAWAMQLFFLRNAPSSSSSPATTTSATTGSAAKPRISAPVGSRVDHKKDEDAIGGGGGGEGGHVAAPATITSPVAISTLRYLIATGLWLLFTNWFFGPPLTERILTATGAVCVPSTNPHSSSPVEALYCSTRTPLSSIDHPALFPSASSSSSLSTPKSIRAMWKGGHDISGHTFIMVLSSLLLLEDVSPYLAAWLGDSFLGQLVFPHTAGRTFDARRVKWDSKAKLAIAATLGLVGIWSWMLLNTAIYFHTPQEKLSGLVVGLLAWLVLPKGN